MPIEEDREWKARGTDKIRTPKISNIVGFSMNGRIVFLQTSPWITPPSNTKVDFMTRVVDILIRIHKAYKVIVHDLDQITINKGFVDKQHVHSIHM